MGPEDRVAEAARLLDRERYVDVRRMLTPVVQHAPDVAPARELLGLAHYRLGAWRKAITELEAFRALTGSVEHHPVLADCYRALKRYRDVDALWEELRAASPSAAIVAEGRIVAASALADRGRMQEAIAMLAPAERIPSKVREHHLRMWYVLADLYDRTGDITRARALFTRIRAHDADFADVGVRLANLA
jgi:tetratricopeptide (TPR) repeat protein